MTIFSDACRSFQGPHSNCLHTSETILALYGPRNYILCLGFLTCPLTFAAALLVHAVFVLTLAVWIVTTAAVIFVLWFQYRLSLILVLLGEEHLQYLDPSLFSVVLYVEVLFVGNAGHMCLLFVDM